MTYLDQPPTEAFTDWLRLVADTCQTDPAPIQTLAEATLLYLRSGREDRATLATLRGLERRWYASLASGDPDWSVYRDPAYLAELWACWVVYARDYLLRVRQQRRAVANSMTVREAIGPVSRVADLGCGFGYSTASLAEVFPGAEVTGFDLAGSPQYRLAERVGAAAGVRIVPTLDAIPAPVDVVFASEYLEHIPAPAAHLTEILDRLRPRVLLLANTFSAPSIGHFPAYEIHGRMVPGRQTSRYVHQELRQRGYAQVSTRLWNRRPAFWRREEML